MEKNIVYLSLGSNIGDKAENLRKAVKTLNQHINVIKISSLYKTEPIGDKNQDDFYNIAVKGDTILTPENLLNTLSRIEKQMHRRRNEKWGPRIIDIDILLFNDLIIKKKELIIPHPYMHKRYFVLIPLKEIEPALMHPEFKKPCSEFISLNNGKVEKIDEEI